MIRRQADVCGALACAVAIVLALPAPAAAQEWTDFVSRDDGFRVNFPGAPKVTETAYESEYGADLPARVYTVERGRERYTMTVVDYGHVERILTERSKACPAYADERCTGYAGRPIVGAGYWMTDIRGALVWASWQFIKRDAKVTDYLWNFVDLVEGHQLQLTNPDRSRTFVSIYMHANRLYIMEGTVPDGSAEPGLFQQSLGFVDRDGNGIRYQGYYDNDYPPPPRVGGSGAVITGGGPDPNVTPRGR
jgi:hypothetical protein